jgi:superfamily II DNA/RNA helicase
LIAEGHSAKPNILIYDLKDYENQYDTLPYLYDEMTPAIWYNGTNFEDVLFIAKEMISRTDENGKKVFDKAGNEILDKTGKSAIKTKQGHIYNVDPSTLLNKRHAYDFCVCMFEPRNKIITDVAFECISGGYKGLTSVTKTAHGYLLEEMFLKRGIETKFLYGGNSIEERLEWLNKLKKGSIRMLIASSIFNVGIDVPDFSIIINAAGGKAYVELIQKIGRGLRKKEGENVLTYIDFIDAQNKYTMEHSVVRVEEYEKQNFDIAYA